MAEVTIGLGIIILAAALFISAGKCHYCGSDKVIHKFAFKTKGVCLKCIWDGKHNA